MENKSGKGKKNKTDKKQHKHKSFTIRLTKANYKYVQEYCLKTHTTKIDFFNDLISKNFETEKDINILYKKLNRLGNSLFSLDRKTDICIEMMELFLKLILTIIPEIAETEIEDVKYANTFRHKKWVSILMEKLMKGDTFISFLKNKIFEQQDKDFFNDN